jgi:hypothetical protein
MGAIIRDVRSSQDIRLCSGFIAARPLLPRNIRNATHADPGAPWGIRGMFSVTFVAMNFNPKAIFQRDERYEGVRRINIYLLRLLYILMFFVLGKETWTHVLTHKGPWEPNNAVVWCVWTAFATLAGIGIFRPVKMIPMVLLEIFYKAMWLIIVAYPLWAKGALWGSPADGITSAFLWLPLPIVAVPWGYVFATYLYKAKK